MQALCHDKVAELVNKDEQRKHDDKYDEVCPVRQKRIQHNNPFKLKYV
jgi:hypothetical protein